MVTITWGCFTGLFFVMVFNWFYGVSSIGVVFDKFYTMMMMSVIRV